MIYEQVMGFFNFEEVYDIALNEAFISREKSVFVEVGALYGKSTTYMLEKMIEMNLTKKVSFYTIDLWISDFTIDTKTGKVEWDCDYEQKQLKKNVFAMFINNIQKGKGIQRKLTNTKER
jgi:hypothetical protein